MLGLLLSVAVLNTPTSCTWWQRWLGCKDVPRASVERTSSSVTSAGITEKYTIKWTTDGNGNLDSIRVIGTATGQVTQGGTAAAPAVFPFVVTLNWASAPAGQSVATQLCVWVKRRLLWSPSITSTGTCSAIRNYPTGDVAPPPVTVDTTLLAITIPDTVRLFVQDSYNAGKLGITTFEFCPVFTFGDGAQALRTLEKTYCSAALATITKPAVTAQQVRADAACLDWHVEGAGQLTTRVPCDRVFINGVLGQARATKSRPVAVLAEKML